MVDRRDEAASQRRVARPLLLIPNQWSSGAQYALALGLVTLSLLARWALNDTLGIRVPFFLTYGVLLPLVLLVRPGPFLAAAVVGWVGAVFLFLPPQVSLALEGEAEVFMAAIFGAVIAFAALTSWSCARVADAREADRVQLQESERRLQAVLDVLPVGVFIADAEGRLVKANPAASAIWGARLHGEGADARGANYKAWWPRTGRPVEPSEWGLSRALLRGEQVLSEEMDIERASGERGTILSYALPVRDEDGSIAGGIAVNVDITQRNAMEAALRESDRRKDEFLSTLAHELRNPLAAVRMAIGVIGRSGDEPERVRQMADIVERQTAQLVRLIDNLLDVSRITRGDFELNREASDLGLVIAHAVEAVRGTCEAGGLEIDVSLPQEPLVISADTQRLAQVVGNLLSNACKFTNAGGRISISAAREGNEAVIRVKDTGTGIRPEDRERIFEMFSRAKPPGARGLGVGLSLSRAIIELHGGSLRVHSDGQGKGSEFVVRLPAPAATASASAEAHPSAQAAGREGRRVLAVDDNEDALEAVAALLDMNGHSVDTAADGEQALAKARTRHPEVVLLDISMPGMDGYEVARRIRREEWGRTLSLIAMTGWGQEEDKQAAAEAGFDAHLTKPVDPGELERVLGARSRAAAGAR